VVEDAQQLIDRVRSEGIEDVRPVERDPYRPVGLRTVVRQVGQILETGDRIPRGRVEDVGDLGQRAQVRRLTRAVRALTGGRVPRECAVYPDRAS